jgi:hypothetical protein
MSPGQRKASGSAGAVLVLGFKVITSHYIVQEIFRLAVLTLSARLQAENQTLHGSLTAFAPIRSARQAR